MRSPAESLGSRLITPTKRQWPQAALVFAALTAGLGGLLHTFVVGRGLVQWSYDLLLVARPHLHPQEAVMIYMDEDSHQELGQPLNRAWDRSIHARLLDRLTDAGARAVVFDVVSSDPDPVPDRDVALIRAIRRHGRVVLAADTVPANGGQEGVWIRKVIPPTDALLAALPRELDSVGSDELDPSRDFVVRRHFHQRRDDVLASLSWAAARTVGARVTERDTARFDERWVNYYGPPGTLPAVSYWRALDTNAVPAAVFRDKVVFVGARLLTKFAGERKDEYRHPYSYWTAQAPLMSGVEVQATIFLNLLRDDWLQRWPRAVEWWALILLGAGVGFALMRFPPWRATGIAVAAIALTAVLAYALFVGTRTWFPWLLLVVQIVFALLASIVFNSLQLYLQKRLFEQTIALYLSPKLVKKFAADRRIMETFLIPGAEKQTLTILFTDIANFTSISEGLDSDELARTMNAYFEKAINHCIHPTDGTVVKYIGDAIYAFWNAPEPQADHALRACQAALAFRDQEPTYMNGQLLVTRLGLHTGEANVGNFGSTARFDYTALGENVNLASRMEGLNKYLGTTVLATGDTYRAVADQIVSRCAGRFRLKGFEKAVEVHELIGPRDAAEASRVWREQFAEAVRHFTQRRFDAAQTGFRRVIEMRSGDGPSQFYIKHIEELHAHPPSENWTGEIELKEK